MEQLRQISFAFFEAAQSQDKTHGRGRKKAYASSACIANFSGINSFVIVLRAGPCQILKKKLY